MTGETPRLLLVEDDASLSTFLADNLTADGYDVVVTDTVRDGIRELECKRPDLAIVDVGLPDGSGLELISRVRAADGLASRLDPRLPLVVLSGRCGSSADSGLRAGSGRFRVEAMRLSRAPDADRGDPPADARARRPRPRPDR